MIPTDLHKYYLSQLPDSLKPSAAIQIYEDNNAFDMESFMQEIYEDGVKSQSPLITALRAENSGFQKVLQNFTLAVQPRQKPWYQFWK